MTTNHAAELRRFARKLIPPSGDTGPAMLQAANEIDRMTDRIDQLETALRLAADEPNIDRALAIADAALKEEIAE